MKTNNTKTDCHRYNLGEALVDQAVSIYRITHRLSADTQICPHSLHCAMVATENYFLKKTGNSFVRIIFCDLMQRVDVYVNLKYLNNKMVKN